MTRKHDQEDFSVRGKSPKILSCLRPQQLSDDSASFLRAARGGNSEKVLEFLKNGTDINTCNANGLNALHLASKEGHVHIVQDLLARGAKIDAATKKGNTALHIASLAGQEEVVKILVAHSASVNVQSQNGFTPLYMAAQENHDGVVRFLLASGASQSLATEDGFTPLAVALQQGHDKVVAVLLENDTRGKVRLPALHIAAKKDDTKAAALLLQNDHNPDVTSKSGFTPLHIASHYGNENIAAVLLQRGADVNYSAKHNITPLHVAAKWGKSNMVALLLDKGANLESRTRDGLTPLHCAARSGHENVVDMMLQRGAPISAKTKNGLAPLHMASQGDHVDAGRILLHHKAPVDEVTVDYLTALHVAAHCGHVRVAKLLLDRRADPNSRALNGFTPLHIACKKNRIKVVELLLKAGASIEATTESGLTPLHVASFMGCMNIVIYLIQHQASPDEATVRGETPLHLAARANQTDIIRILLRNGAKVDARAREQQTPLHIASRLGNVDIVVLLLQSGAQVDAVTKDLYTALHIAAKEGQEEVASILLEHGASMAATTKKGFTPLHLAAKYGNVKVAKLLLAKETPVDAEGKNGVTPLHVAVHYDNTSLAHLLLEKGASPHAAAKNGYTPLHISAKKNQLETARTLLEYGAVVGAESKAGFTPLHLAAQEGHEDMTSLLLQNNAEVNVKAKNGLTPLHLCAQEDRVEVAKLLVAGGASCDMETKAGYTPLHVAAHFGQVAMVRYLLQQGVRADSQNELGYSPLHQAAQQGHTQIVNLLLEAGASPNSLSNNGQTALCIAQKLGYISVVETLKVVTDQVVTTTTTITTEEKYRVLAPESMQETFMSDSEDEGGEENIQDHAYKYLTTEEMKGLGDDSMQIDVTNDEKDKKDTLNRVAEASIEKKILEMERSRDYNRQMDTSFMNDTVDNIEIPVRPPVSAGFLVSFMVDARGGAMRGCRHSGVRVIIPPRKAPMPMRVTCRYLKKDKLVHPPPLNEGEALASRILELGPAKAQFLGPVIIEVPHFASLRGKEREIVILRSDNGEKWVEHTLEATEEAVQEVLQDSFDGDDTTQIEDLNTNRITRILTTDFPQYFAIVTRIRQEIHAIGPDGGLVNSSVVPQVQAMFPQGALTKKIKVGLQAQPIPPELTAKLLGNRVAVSPIVTVEPRRRKFHKPITLTIPVPVAAGKGMINQYSGDTPTLRLLCSITGGTTRAQWEDVTGSTPLTFLNDCVSFTTTVSARFWLMDCRNVAEATKMATSLYKEAIHVPFMSKFVVFSKRHEQLEARVRVFCMTDDKEEKTLEHQEHFHEIAKSRDVEVLEGKTHYLEFFGNLQPVTKSGEQLAHKFYAFRENRLPFNVRVRDPNNEPVGRVGFFREPKQGKGEVQQAPICNLNLALPLDISPEPGYTDTDLLAIQAKYSFLREAGYGKFDTIHRADLRVSDISNLLGGDWVRLARELGVEEQDINLIMSEYPDNVGQQAMVMLRLWLNTEGNKATGNALEKALQKCDRQDIVNKCMFNMAEVTDSQEIHLAASQLEQENGFESFKAGLHELGPAKNSTLKRDYSLDVSYDENEVIEETRHLENISEEYSSQSETITEKYEKEDEAATSVYEREEHKYLAEEKELLLGHSSAYSQQQHHHQVETATEVRTSTNEMKQESTYLEQSQTFSESREAASYVEERLEVSSKHDLQSESQFKEETFIEQKEVMRASSETKAEQVEVRASSEVVEEIVMSSGEFREEVRASSEVREETKTSSEVREEVRAYSSEAAELRAYSEAMDEVRTSSEVREEIRASSEAREEVRSSSVEEAAVSQKDATSAEAQQTTQEEEEVVETIGEVAEVVDTAASRQRRSISSSTEEEEEEEPAPGTGTSLDEEGDLGGNRTNEKEEEEEEEDEDDGIEHVEFEDKDAAAMKDDEATSHQAKDQEAAPETTNAGKKPLDEKTEEEINGLKDEDSFEIVKPATEFDTGSVVLPSSSHLMPQHSSSYSDHEDQEESDSSPKSPSPKVSPCTRSLKNPSEEVDQPGQNRTVQLSATDQKHVLLLPEFIEVEKELADEMIIRDESLPSLEQPSQYDAIIEETSNIGEAAEKNSSHSECKDVDICGKQITSPVVNPLSLLSNTSLSCNLHRDSYEMPSKQQLEQEVDIQSPSTAGFVATDSKDSLEVQAHSVIDDISETMSGREESLEDIKYQQATSSDDSEDGQENKVAIEEDFELIQGYEIIEDKEKEEIIQKSSSEFEGKESFINSQMKNVMDIFEKIENESVNGKDKVTTDLTENHASIAEKNVESKDIEQVKEECLLSDSLEAIDTSITEREDHGELAAVSLKAITAKIEKFVEAKEEVIATTAYMTTGELEEPPSDYTVQEPMVFKPGTLKVNIIKATGLVNQDFVGKSDPYVLLKFKNQVHRSQTISDSLDPVWNFSVDLDISDSYSDILVEVYDDDYGRDNFEGGLTLTLSELLQHADHESVWYNLADCKSGKILMSSSYSTSNLSVPVTKEPEVEDKEKAHCKLSSSDSSSEEMEVHPKIIAEASTDSSVSTKQESTIKKLIAQDTVEENESLVLDVQKEQRDTSSDSSDTEDEKRVRNVSSSDYDSSVHGPPRGKRPESFISDNSSDYDSLSDVGKHRPQSFVLDDEYEVIAEEESESKVTDEKDKHSSSSPDADEAEVMNEKQVANFEEEATVMLSTPHSASSSRQQGK